MTPHALPSRTAPRWSTRQLAGAALLVAAGLFALVGPLVGGDPLRQDLSRVLEAPGGTFLLGTDHLGRNMLARLAHAARLSLGLAMLTVVSAAIPGTLLGIAAAWRGGWLERVLAGIADGVLALPALLLVALLTAVAPVPLAVLPSGCRSRSGSSTSASSAPRRAACSPVRTWKRHACWDSGPATS